MNIDYINMIDSAILLSIPLIFTAIGGAFSVRSGVMALGLEGQLLAGAFCAAVGSFYTGNPMIGVLCGILGGMFIGFLHALLSVKYRVNQVISGIGLNLLAISGSTLLMQQLWNSRGFSPKLNTVSSVDFTWLSNMPVLYQLFGTKTYFFYWMILIIIISYYVIFKTNFGLRLRMVGENPIAAMTLGINVVLYKYIGVMIGGALAGMGGSYLSIGYLNLFTREISAGRGYIAVVVNILGGYNPLTIAGTGFIFSIANSLQVMLQGSEISTYVIGVIPYVVTLIVLVVGGRRIRQPKGMSKHHK